MELVKDMMRIRSSVVSMKPLDYGREARATLAAIRQYCGSA